MNVYTTNEIASAERFARPWTRTHERVEGIRNLRRYGEAPISPYAAPNTYAFELRDKAEARRCATILESTL